MLRFHALDLVEHQVAQRIEDGAGAVQLPGLGDVRMVARDDTGARVDGGTISARSLSFATSLRIVAVSMVATRSSTSE
jgi:hypothetical protein